MQNSSKTHTWANDDIIVEPTEHTVPVNMQSLNAGVADERPSQAKKSRTQEIPDRTDAVDTQSVAVDQNNRSKSEDTGAPEVEAAPMSDMDWLRSQTSRLLGPLDENEQVEFEERKAKEPAKSQVPTDESHDSVHAIVESPPATNGHNEDEAIQARPEKDENVDLIHSSARLFLRNLPYDLTEADLQPLFAPFGKLEEVSFIVHYFIFQRARTRL